MYIIHSKFKIGFLLFAHILLQNIHCRANLYVIPLGLTLSSNKVIYAANEPIQFNLEFKNMSYKSGSILLPGSQNKGNKIVYLSFFKVDKKTDFYTEVAKENRTIEMRSAQIGTSQFGYLHPGESNTIPLFINDKKNYYTHTEAHHAVPNLPIGEYAVLARYYPWDDSLAKYAFQKISVFDKGHQVFDTNKFNIPDEGLVSNYTYITITEKIDHPNTFKPTKDCPENCNFCKMIEANDWQKVGQAIESQTFYNGISKNRNADSNWRMPHKNVAWLSNEPDEILSSLPTSTSRQIIFSNSKGYHYFYASWQLGIVYTTRARMKSISHYLFRKPLPVSTSNINYIQLKYFGVW